jgi:uncharacterized protein
MFVATLIRSTFGFGEALIAVPLLALCTPVTIAAPLAVLMSVVVAGAIVAKEWRQVDVRSASGLVVASLFGIPCGVWLLAKANDHLVKAALGAVIVVFSIWSLTSGRRRHLPHDHRGWLVTCGFLAGVLGGAYGMNGPPLVVYGSMRRWPPQRFRASLQGYFLPASLVGMFGYWAAGLWTPRVNYYFAIALPAVLLAIPIGRAIAARLDPRRFALVVHAGLLASGVGLVLQAIVSWNG